MKPEAEMMAEIVKRVGDTTARQMVVSAYNAEIISNRLGRLEKQDNKPHLAKRGTSNLLHLAVQRVYEVVMLGE